MRRAVLPVALLLLTTTVAGCIGGDDGTADAANPTAADSGASDVTSTVPVVGTGPGAPDAAGAADPGERPRWTHGDWWTYNVQLDLGFGKMLDGDTKAVLYDTATGYKVAAADRNAGIADAYFDTFFVGTLDQDLAATIYNQKFQMFQWPIEDGKSWTGNMNIFTGEEPVTITFNLVATAVPNAEDPRGATPGFRIVGTSPSGWAIEYVYSPLSKWITRMTITAAGNPDNGEPESWPFLVMDLKESGSNYEGTFRVITMDWLYLRIVVPVAAAFGETEYAGVPPADVVAIPEGYTFTHRIAGIFGFPLEPGTPAASAQGMEMVSPTNEPHEYTMTGEGFQLWIEEEEPPVAGEWKIAYESVGTGGIFGAITAFKEQVVEFTSASHANHQ